MPVQGKSPPRSYPPEVPRQLLELEGKYYLLYTLHISRLRGTLLQCKPRYLPLGIVCGDPNITDTLYASAIETIIGGKSNFRAPSIWDQNLSRNWPKQSTRLGLLFQAFRYHLCLIQRSPPFFLITSLPVLCCWNQYL